MGHCVPALSEGRAQGTGSEGPSQGPQGLLGLCGTSGFALGGLRRYWRVLSRRWHDQVYILKRSLQICNLLKIGCGIEVNEKNQGWLQSFWPKQLEEWSAHFLRSDLLGLKIKIMGPASLDCFEGEEVSKAKVYNSDIQQTFNKCHFSQCYSTFKKSKGINSISVTMVYLKTFKIILKSPKKPIHSSLIGFLSEPFS